MARKGNRSKNGRGVSIPQPLRYRSTMPRSRPSLSPLRPRPLRAGPYYFKPISMTLPGDRRTFHPAPTFSRPAFSKFQRSATRLVMPNPVQRAALMNKRASGWATAFDKPRDVMVCVRRKIRREVIHALGLGGAAGMVPRKRNPFSGVSC